MKSVSKKSNLKKSNEPSTQRKTGRTAKRFTCQLKYPLPAGTKLSVKSVAPIALVECHSIKYPDAGSFMVSRNVEVLSDSPAYKAHWYLRRIYASFPFRGKRQRDAAKAKARKQFTELKKLPLGTDLGVVE